MHDLKALRADPHGFDAALARRGLADASAAILAADADLRAIQTRLQADLARRNEASKAIGAAMGRGDTGAAEALKAEVASLKDRIAAAEAAEAEAIERVETIAAAIPNTPAPDTPDGPDETANVEVARWGTPRNGGLEHDALAARLGWNAEASAKISGSRFMVLEGPLARLHRALGQFMLDEQVKRGWRENFVPLLVRDHSMFGTGQLPKFGEDLFFSADDPNRRRLLDQALEAGSYDNAVLEGAKQGRLPSQVLRDVLAHAATAEQFWLIPTAEVSLTNLVRESILEAETLPLRLTALTPCFRSEAGAAGKDTRGLIRQHQFEKVELVSICTPEAADAEHEHMVRSAEAILEALDLPYRRVALCAGDLGFSAKRTFDLEVWLPGAGTFREISSISWCGDFQARRMDARFRVKGEKGTRFVHTLNGSGLAVGRTLVAVLENHQNPDGSVTIPPPLHPYMGGLTTLEP